MKSRNLFSALVVFSVLIMTGGCGSSGGGAPALQSLAYVGNTEPANITLDNAPTLIVNALYGGATAAGIPTGVLLSESEADSGHSAAISDRIVSLLDYTTESLVGSAVNGYSMPLGFEVNETISCDSGYWTMVGILDDATATGTLAVNYVNCVLDGMTYNGPGTLTVHYIDIYTLSFNMTLDFVLLTMSSPDFSGSMSGSISIDESFSGSSVYETITLNTVAQDDVLGKMYKYVNYMMQFYIENILYSLSEANLNINGEIYDSIHGGILTETNFPLVFSSQQVTEPDSGGPLRMIGKNTASIQLTVLSGRHVLLEFDLDGNGINEATRTRYVLWQEIDDYTSLDLADTDGDTMHNSWEEMYMLDPDVDDADDDADTDGYTNLEEYQGGSDPQNISSTPSVP